MVWSRREMYRHHPTRPLCSSHTLTIRLRDALNLVLLLDRIAVGGFLGGVHDLIGEALRDGLDVAERAIAGTCADEVNGLVHTAQRRDIDGLTSHDTCRTDARPC